MAFTSVGSIGTSQNKTAAGSLAMTTSAAAAVGSLVVVAIAKDNTTTTNGSNGEFSGVTDSAGNTYSELFEYTYGTPGANNSACAAIYFCVLGTALPSGGTITASFTSVTAKAMTAWNWSISGSSASSAATPIGTFGGSGVSIAFTDLPSTGDYLILQAMGAEGSLTTLPPADATWTAFTQSQTAGGSAVTNMTIAVMFKVYNPGTSSISGFGSFPATDSVYLTAALAEGGSPPPPPAPVSTGNFLQFF